MTRFLRKYQIHIMSATLAFFVIYIVIVLGGSIFSKGSLNDSVVDVDGQKVPLRIFLSHYNREVDSTKGPLDDAAKKQKRDEVIRDLVQMVVFDREARHYGIVVPDSQVANSLTQVPAFQTKGVFDPQVYMRTLLYQLKTSPQDFEDEQRKSIAFFKLRWLIQSSVKVTDNELDMAYQLQLKDPTYKGQAKPDKTLLKPGTPEDREAFRDHLWQEKVFWTLNQWFGQIGQKLHVKTHTDRLEGMF